MMYVEISHPDHLVASVPTCSVVLQVMLKDFEGRVAVTWVVDIVDVVKFPGIAVTLTSHPMT